MTSGTSIVFGSFADYSVCITDEEEVEGIFLILRPMHTQILQNKFFICIFLNYDFWKVAELLGGMVFVEEIIAIVVVNFQITDVNIILMSRILLYFAENVRKSSWDDATVGVSFCTSSNSKCLSTSRLSIRKYSTIVPIKRIFNNIFGNGVENSFLASQHV